MLDECTIPNFESRAVVQDDKLFSHGATHGDLLYVLSSSGLDVFDMSDGSVLLGTIDLCFDATDIGISGDSLMLTGYDELEMYQLVDPLNLNFLGRIEGYFEDPLLADSVLYARRINTETIESWDVSNPAAPNQLWSLAGRSFGFDVEDSTLAVSSVSGVTVYDLSNPQPPIERYNLPDIGSVILEGDMLIFIDRTLSFDIYDALTGQMVSRTPVDVDGGVYHDQKLYLSANGGVEVYDISNPSQPSQTTTQPLGVLNLQLHVQNNVLTALGATGMTIMDATTLAVESSTPNGISFGAFQAEGDLSLILEYSFGNGNVLAAYDVSDRSTPVRRGILDDAGYYIVRIIPETSIAVVSDDDGDLKFIDFSDMDNPQVFYTHLFSWVRAISLWGDWLAVSPGITSPTGLVLYDISQPATPVERGQLSWAPDVFTVVGDKLYAASSTTLIAYDISDPLNIVEVEQVQTQSYGWHLSSVDGYLLLAMLDGTTHVWDETQSLSNSPQTLPFRILNPQKKGEMIYYLESAGYRYHSQRTLVQTRDLFGKALFRYVTPNTIGNFSLSENHIHLSDGAHAYVIADTVTYHYHITHWADGSDITDLIATQPL